MRLFILIFRYHRAQYNTQQIHIHAHTDMPLYWTLCEMCVLKNALQ